MLYVLDTNTITAWQHKHALVVARVKAVPGTELCVTIIPFEEQCIGRLNVLNRRLSTAQRIEAYQRLTETLDFYNAVKLLPYEDVAARLDSQLAATLRHMGAKDRRIAAITLANSATLVTRNTVHFKDVPGLRLEDWMVP